MKIFYLHFKFREISNVSYLSPVFCSIFIIVIAPTTNICILIYTNPRTSLSFFFFLSFLHNLPVLAAAPDIAIYNTCLLHYLHISLISLSIPHKHLHSNINIIPHAFNKLFLYNTRTLQIYGKNCYLLIYYCLSIHYYAVLSSHEFGVCYFQSPDFLLFYIIYFIAILWNYLSSLQLQTCQYIYIPLFFI